jgi:curved DNA-binding protein CbpA
VRSSDKTLEHQPNPDLFRDVVEAYQVLSVRDSRASYDLSRRKNPDLYKAAVSEFQYDMDNRRDKRDKSGMIPKSEKPVRGSYAENRLAQLKKDREQYNVNHLGFYSGGNPVKGRGPIRGKALGNTGEFHTPQIHNYLNYNHQDSSFLSSEDAIKFKHWMGSDIVDF